MAYAGMIRYEMNPPKMQEHMDEQKRKFVSRAARISKWCGSIHITEDVLGRRRLPPAEAGVLVRRILPNVKMTASLRTRYRTLEQIVSTTRDCTRAGFDGILVVMGDKSDGMRDVGPPPSSAVRHIREVVGGAGNGAEMYLSVPARPGNLEKKMAASPDAFITQVVDSTEQILAIKKKLGGFRVIPILMYPSEKNNSSAKLLNLQMSYGDDFAGFVEMVHGITGDVLITSPLDFEGAYEFLKRHSTKYSASG